MEDVIHLTSYTGVVLSEDQHEQRSPAQRNATQLCATQPCATQRNAALCVGGYACCSIMNIEQLFLNGYS